MLFVDSTPEREEEAKDNGYQNAVDGGEVYKKVEMSVTLQIKY
jgi:hypothetical protein